MEMNILELSSKRILNYENGCNLCGREERERKIGTDGRRLGLGSLIIELVAQTGTALGGKGTTINNDTGT